MILEAINLAKKAHEGQQRRFSGEPYIVHPARVAMRVSLLSYADESMIAAAWLHDVLEDTSIRLEQIIARTNHNVGHLVKELTFDEKNLGNLTYHQRKTIQNAHVAQGSFRAKSIKILDRTDNLEDFEWNLDIGSCPKEKLERYVLSSCELQKMLVAQSEKEVDLALVSGLGHYLLSLAKKYNFQLE